MQGLFVLIAFNTAMELLLIRTFCQVLAMRSKVVFAAAELLLMLASSLMYWLGVSDLVRLPLINVAHAFAVPIALSAGSLRTRISRTGMVNLAALLAESLATLVYTRLSGTAYPAGLDGLATLDGIRTLTITVLALYVALEYVAATYAGLDLSFETQLGASSLMLTILTLAFYGLISLYCTSLGTGSSRDAFLSFASAVCCLMTLAFGIMATRVAQQEAKFHQELANRTVRTRQMRHVLAEVRTLEHGLRKMSALRHDLANQIGTATQLARNGQQDESRAYLARVRQEVRHLSGETHE